MSIVEVAKAAGVSTATVSRVFNGGCGVRPSTAARVESIARAGRRAARSGHPGRPLRRHKSGRRPLTIAVLAIGHDHAWLTVPQLAAVLSGVQRATLRHELSLSLEHTSFAGGSRLVASGDIDGVVALVSGEMPSDQAGAVLKAIRHQVPLVWAMGSGPMVDGVDQITPQEASIGTLAAAHLRAKGCRHLALVTTPPRQRCLRERGQAFLAAAVDAGVPARSYVVGRGQSASADFDGHATAVPTLDELVARFAADEVRPDGWFLAGHHAVTELYPLLARHGLRAGQDVHVVSCNNEEAGLACLNPFPPSIDVGSEEIGYRATVQLLNRIAQPDGPPLVIQVTPRLYESVDLTRRWSKPKVKSGWNK